MKTTKVVLQTHTIKRTSLIENLKKHWQLFLFLILPLLYIIIFAYGPMMGLQIAFKDFDAAKGVWGSPWVGLKHFKNFISSYQFARVLKNTLVTSVYSLVARFPVPILLALSINIMRNKRFKKATQMIVYVPHFISVVVLVGMVNQFFNPFVGLYGNIYKMMFGTNAPDLLSSPTSFLHLYVWSGVWQKMDGASRLRRVISIDLPAIMPTIILLLIINAGQVMNLGFEKIYLMQNDVNLRLSEVISTYVYKVGISASGGNYSYATAIGMFNSIINFILVSTVNWLANKYGDTSLW